MRNRKANDVRAFVRVVVAVALVACGSSSPYLTRIGILKPGGILTIQLDAGTLNAYQPARGQPRDMFTISSTAIPKQTPPPPPRVHASPTGLVVTANGNLASLLVRVPDGVDLVVESKQGDVNVTDISGTARVVAQNGNVALKVPRYAQATVGNGNLSVMMGATTWPGTLGFSTRRGDIQVWIVAKAAFGVHMHTDDGTLFTDFGLRGVSNGTAETIDGDVNGGATQRVNVETAKGSIQLLRLQPQP
jgi:hypothetical protein